MTASPFWYTAPAEGIHCPHRGAYKTLQHNHKTKFYHEQRLCIRAARIFDSIQWRRKRIFTESEAYLDLLQMAYYGSEPTERMVGRRSFIVKRGQIITTTSFLADRWGWKLHRVRYVLRALSVTSFVTSVVTSGRTIITVNQGNTSNC